jgi:hypothetical protein
MSFDWHKSMTPDPGSLFEFSEPGFPHNFAKNDRQDLKLRCIDVSRRQLQFVLKNGV